MKNQADNVALVAALLSMGCSEDNAVEPAPADTVTDDDASELEGDDIVGGTKEEVAAMSMKMPDRPGDARPTASGYCVGRSHILDTHRRSNWSDWRDVNEGDFTVFAPNDAFNVLEDGVLEALLADTEQLQRSFFITCGWEDRFRRGHSASIDETKQVSSSR